MLYLSLGILIMIIRITKPGYIQEFKDGFDEEYYNNENVKEYFENNETLYKVGLFAGIFSHVLTIVLLWPMEILKRLLS